MSHGFSLQVRTVLLLGALTLAGMGQAWAHAHVVSQTPAQGTAAASPPETCVEFDSPLEVAFSQLNVQGPQGTVLDTGDAELRNDAHVLCASLPAALPGGDYEAHWVAVASDGHRMQGTYSFSVR